MIGVATPGVSFAASCLVGSIWLMVPKCNIESGYCLDLGFELKKNFFVRTRTQDCFRWCRVYFSNILFEISNFGLNTILLPCLLSEMQNSSFLEMEPW